MGGFSLINADNLIKFYVKHINPYLYTNNFIKQSSVSYPCGFTETATFN